VNLPVILDGVSFRDLPTEALKTEARRKLLRLKRQPFYGEELGYREYTGDLSDCRKIYLYGGTPRPTHRIVYRVRPNEENPRDVEVVSVGPRAGGKVYLDAVLYLGRLG